MIPEKKFHLQSQKDRPHPLRTVNFILPPCSNGVGRGGVGRQFTLTWSFMPQKHRNELIKMK